MSFLQMDLPADQVADKSVRRALINAIVERTPTGLGRGQRSARKARKVGEVLGEKVAIDGASPEVLNALGIPAEWAGRCEDAAHIGHDGMRDSLALRLDWLRKNQFSNFVEKIGQLGSYGGEIILENVKWCACWTMIGRAQLLKYLVCVMVLLDFCHIAAREVSVTHWRVASSELCSRNLRLGIFHCLGRTRNWFMRL